MLKLALMCLVAALVAAALKMSGVAQSALNFAMILFLVFLVIFVMAAAIRAVERDDT